MNKTIIAIGIAGLAMLADPSAALAHGNNRHAAERPAKYHFVVERPGAMPLWLRRDPYFVDWYRYAPLLRNHHLTWWQLHDAYQRDHRYAALQWSRGYQHYGPPDRNWYRRFWKSRYRKHRHHRH
jgi:hypothetical protein